jgi:protein gp37
MGYETLIAWTDHTFNPWMGCVKVSEGCRNCYAERLVKNKMGLNVWGVGAPRQRTKTPWENLRKWNLQAGESGVIRKVFCASLCDVFEDHPDANKTRADLWRVIKESKNLIFQMLTKRPENITGMLPADWNGGWKNVWLGTSVENMDVSNRVDFLRSIPAPVRFISYEPALGPLDDLDITGIDWIIYGGESGPKFRLENKQWARTMHAKCSANKTAFFHKQSSGIRTEMGIELDGVIVREYPIPR